METKNTQQHENLLTSNMMKHSFQHQNKRPCSINIYLKNVVIVGDNKRRTIQKCGISFHCIIFFSDSFCYIIVSMMMMILLYQIDALQ
jgi:hypothetical protein